MNTRFSFTLLVIIVATIAAACAPKIVDSAAPVELAVPPADQNSTALMPVTGASAPNVKRAPQADRLQSGEIFLSDTNSPDVTLHNNVPSHPQTSAECMSEDIQPRRQGGCVD